MAGYDQAMSRWEFYTEAAAFLRAASGYLARDPVVNSVIATIAERASAHGRPVFDGLYWFAVLREADAVASVAMRTAPAPPHPLFVLPMDGDEARGLAQILHRRGEQVGGVNGALPAAEVLAQESARLQEQASQQSMHSRLFRLDDLIWPRPVSGRLRPAGAGDLDLALSWSASFEREAEEQAGRTPGHTSRVNADVDAVRRRIETGGLWFWEDDGGVVVHMTGARPPSFGAARIAPVYTPPEHRGRGWASAAVAEVTDGIQRVGAIPCLFTDQANPVSNAIYQALGYRPVLDMASVVVH